MFPSWRIVSAYYALYFFLRSVTIQKEPNVNIQRHSSTINAFKHNLLIHEAQQGCRDATYEPSRFPVAVPYPSPHRATPAYVVVTSSDLDTSRNKASVSGLSWISRKHNVLPSLESSIWSFPFDIAWTPGVKVFKRETVVAQLPHLRYKYAQHPREPNRSPIESFEFIRGYFRQRVKARKNPTTYNLNDLLTELRVWANYIDIEPLAKLSGTVRSSREFDMRAAVGRT